VTIAAAECGTKGAILQNDFETLFTINGKPSGAALFTSPDEEDGSQSFYFSPGAVAIARGLIEHFSGQPSSPPAADMKNPKLLVGRSDERDVLLSAAGAQKPRAKSKFERILGRK
jgi:hypothetical protein